MLAALTGVVASVAQGGDGGITVEGSGPQELTVTVGGRDLADAGRLELGDEFWDRGEKEAAVRHFAQIVEGPEVSGLEAKARYRLGLCHLQNGDGEAAVGMWQEASLDRSDPDAAAWSQYCLAWMESGRGGGKKAIAMFQAIIDAQLAGDEDVYAWSLYQIGRIHQQWLHDYEAADAAFKKVMSLHPHSEPALRNCWRQ